MNKVLIITYYWPPGGGAGVQRWLKFARYLPEQGWEPVILTVEPDCATYPVIDNSLGKDLPPSIKVIKTPATDYFRMYNKDKSRIPSAGFANNPDYTIKGRLQRFIRGNLFIPDPRKGWNSYAFRKACEIIDSEKIKNIITSSPPHSTQLIGLNLKKRYHDIQWIADLRDPWTDIYYYDQFFPTLIARKIDSCYEKKVLKNADRIVTVGPSMKKLFSSKIKGTGEKTEVITNGYDEDDFRGRTGSSPATFTITYTGTLSDAYPIGGLMDALDQLRQTVRDFRLKFIGSVSPGQKNIILSGTTGSEVEFIPHVEHGDAIELMLSSSLLLLIIPDHKGNKNIVTGKLFEYLASGRPVICLGPSDGDAAEILDHAGNGKVLSYHDSEGIYHYLSDIISGKAGAGKRDIMDFSRRELTRKIIPLLRQA